MLCLVSGGADSTCLFHALRELGYRVSALHVDHGLRGEESDADARWCAEQFDAEVVQGAARCATEAALRDIRYSFRADRLRATGHTLSDQVETILYRLATSGNTKGIKVRREDGVVRPLLCVWREETEAFCRERGLEWREDSSNPDTMRGADPQRDPPAARADPSGRAREHPARRSTSGARCRRRSPSCSTPRPARSASTSAAACRRCASTTGCGSSRGPRDLDGTVEWGAWRIESRLPGLKVRGWRPGDRLAGRSRKVQDVFVDAKIPRSDREGWPLVVRGDEVVAVPGIVEAEGVSATRVAD